MGKKGSAPALFSHAEFDALPHSVQRKYFDSLERLRIADQHQGRHQHHPHPLVPPHHHLALAHDTSTRSSRSHHSHFRSRSHSLSLNRPLTSNPGSRRCTHRKANSLLHLHHHPHHPHHQPPVSPQDVQFFLSLPSKLRRQHFSPEEQLLLAGSCRQPPTAHHERTRQRFGDFDFRFFDDDDSDSAQERGRLHSRTRRLQSPSVSPTRLSPHPGDRDTVVEDGLRSCDPMSLPTSSQTPPTSAPFRRTMSLTSIPFRAPSSSAPPVADSALLPFSPLWHQRSGSRSGSISRSGRRSSHAPAAPVFDPEATHYRDPEARKKLRMFLASPQKFDEAVEFGFPSTASDDTIRPRFQLPPISTDARNFSRDMHTFLRDDKISFLDDDDDDNVNMNEKSDTDNDSVTDLESPITPSSIGLSFRGHSRHASHSNFSSLDSTGLPPIHPMQGRLNREMTLRMTLTRPDLRADEEQLYGWQAPKSIKDVKDDPFALEDLHLSDDMTGSNGAFAVKPKPQGNLVTRLFRRAGRKGGR